MPKQRELHIMFVRLYLSESPCGDVRHLEMYQAIPIQLANTAEGQELFDAILALIRSKVPTFSERGSTFTPKV